MDKYRMLNKKGEGTFSEVLKCQNVKDGTFWACKRMKQRYTSVDELKEIREIQALRYLSNSPYILHLHEVVYERRTGALSLIFELMDMNLLELIKLQRSYMNIERVAKFTYQILRAIEHMHKFGYFHRDIKPENILIKGDLLKLADFGSCRKINTKHPYTEYISTRWYRSPECLLTDGYYNHPMDIWGAGCVMFEMITLHPLFPGSNEIDQIDKIHDVFGTPEPLLLEKFKKLSRNIRYTFRPKKGIGLDKYMSNFNLDSVDLIKKLCTYDPDLRITANRAIKHKFFDILIKHDKEKETQKFFPAPRKSIDSNASEPIQVLMSNKNMGKKKTYKKYNSITSLSNYVKKKDAVLSNNSLSNIVEKEPVINQYNHLNLKYGNQQLNYPAKRNYLKNTALFFPKIGNNISHFQNDNGSASSGQSMLSKASNYSTGLPDIYLNNNNNNNNNNQISNFITE
ncbi:MAPK MAK MRK overlapping kinase-like, partial [Brachionus plicatilis]